MREINKIWNSGEMRKKGQIGKSDKMRNRGQIWKAMSSMIALLSLIFVLAIYLLLSYSAEVIKKPGHISQENFDYNDFLSEEIELHGIKMSVIEGYVRVVLYQGDLNDEIQDNGKKYGLGFKEVDNILANYSLYEFKKVVGERMKEINSNSKKSTCFIISSYIIIPSRSGSFYKENFNIGQNGREVFVFSDGNSVKVGDETGADKFSLYKDKLVKFPSFKATYISPFDSKFKSSRANMGQKEFNLKTYYGKCLGGEYE